MMIDCARLERLATSVGAPQIYVVTEKHLPMHDSSGGCTHPEMDLSVRAQLEQEGRYAGRRAALALSESVLLDTAQYRAADESEVAREFEAVVLGCFSHELAHVCQRQPPYYDTAEMPEEDRDRRARILRMAAAMSPSDSYAAQLLPPWWGHGADWLRLSLHLAYRLGQAVGVNLHWRLATGWLTGVSLFRLVAHLEDEPEELQGLPIEEIKGLDPPAGYKAEWADVFE